MEPQTFICGNMIPADMSVCLPVGFNGAADFHLRKSRLRHQANPRARCFNGAADFHLRKFILLNSRNARILCFNGAADFHLRKYLLFDHSLSSFSMLQWSRRLSSAEIACLFSLVFPRGSVAIFERLGFLLPVQSKKHAQLIPGDSITYCYFKWLRFIRAVLEFLEPSNHSQPPK